MTKFEGLPRTASWAKVSRPYGTKCVNLHSAAILLVVDALFPNPFRRIHLRKRASLMHVAFMRFTGSCRMAISTVTVLMATTLAVLAVTLLGTRPAQAQDWKPDYSLRPRPDGPGVDSLAKPEPVNAHMFDGPASPGAFQPWLRGLRTWREQRKKEIGYHDDLFQQNELRWARLTITQDELLVWDRSRYESSLANTRSIAPWRGLKTALVHLTQS
jgi:hypothetical protein